MCVVAEQTAPAWPWLWPSTTGHGWEAHTLCLHFHRAFTAPRAPPAPITARIRVSCPPDEPPSARPYRATTPTERPSIVSPSRSLLLSYQHHLARSGTQARRHAPSQPPPPPPPPCLAPPLASLSHSCECFCKKRLLQPPRSSLLTCVFSLNYHRAWGGARDVTFPGRRSSLTLALRAAVARARTAGCFPRRQPHNTDVVSKTRRLLLSNIAIALPD